MINALHLLWIVPLTAVITTVILCFCAYADVCKEEDDMWWEEKTKAKQGKQDEIC